MVILEMLSQVTDEDIMKEAKPSFYLKMILPILFKNRVVHFLGFGNRLAFDPIPFQLQVNHQPLTFQPITSFRQIYWTVIVTWASLVCYDLYAYFGLPNWGTSYRDFDADVIFTPCDLFLKYKKLVLCFFKGYASMQVTLGHWIIILLVHLQYQIRRKAAVVLRNLPDIQLYT